MGRIRTKNVTILPMVKYLKAKLEKSSLEPHEIQNGQLNDLWAKKITEELIYHGVRHFSIGPGSRATPLILAAAQHPLAETTVHFDERGIGYHALGYVKGSGNPAAIITTSGSAVGNLFPAIMEASLENLPLIILTADRPPELRETGANQTLDQVKVFGDHVRFHIDLPCPDPSIPERYITTTIAQAIHRSFHPPTGPIHINCMFREPFFGHKEMDLINHDQEIKTSHTAHTNLFLPTSSLSSNQLDELAEELSSIENGLILAAHLPPSMPPDPLLLLASKLRWPIFSDVLSGFRTVGREKLVIPFYELMLKSLNQLDDFPIKAVLYFGDYMVSKTLMEWIRRQPLNLFAHVANHPKRIDPHHIVTHRIDTSPNYFCDELCKRLPRKTENTWTSSWKSLSLNIEEKIIDYFDKKTSVSEQQIIRFLADELDYETHLFLSNSMPIRDAEALLFPKGKIGKIYGNRGHSGIDGNIATALGISKGAETKMIVLLGDLAFLHDMNSLALLKEHPYPITFIVFNNQGGGIFSFLPISQKKDVFEKFFAASHCFELGPAGSFFGLEYFQPKSIDQFLTAMEKIRTMGKHALIEIQTNREANYREHAELIAFLRGTIKT